MEELILSSHAKDSLNEQTDQPRGDVNESLIKWLQRDDYLLFWEDTSMRKALWAEWDLVEALLKVVEKLFPKSMFGCEATLGASLSSSSIE